MDSQSKDGDSDSRESHGLKISDLLQSLAERRSPPCDLRYISATLSNTGTGVSNTRGTFRSRAVLPENINQLSKGQFKRRDHLSESLVPVPAPITAKASSQEGPPQPSLLPSSNPVVLAHLVEKSKMLPSDSASSIEERLEKHEICPYVLGVHAWTNQQSCGPAWTLPQTEPTTELFFEDLTDLQRKLFVGAPKKSQTARKTTRGDLPESTALPSS